MASLTYDSLCKELYRQIYQRLERREDDRLRFAPRGTSSSVLHQDNLKLVYQCVAPSLHIATRNALAEEDFLQRVNERSLQRFLAILIFAGCSIDALVKFTSRLAANDVWLERNGGRSAYRLPLELSVLDALFRDDDDDVDDNINAYKFYTTQACFCPLVIRSREEMRIEFPERYRLPYMEEQQRAEGSFGKVYEVKVAKGHFLDSWTTSAPSINAEAINVARKDYVITPETRVKREREIMEIIFRSSSRSENVLESLGALEIGDSKYCLFMPLAICDLRAYMMENHTAAPNTDEAKANYIRCAEGLAGGLSFLHEGIDTPELDKLVCYHMDLKPENILLFQENGRWVWKLSDFGMSCVKKRRRVDQYGEVEKDFTRWFVRRRKPDPEPSIDPTRNNRGEGTYLAPESTMQDARMAKSSDVWSLGCVISVLFAYLDDGKDGVLAYHALRRQHRQSDGYDRFFLTNGFLPNSVHPSIEKHHDKLIKNAKSRSSREAKAVEFMLNKLESSVLKIEQDKRISAADLKAHLQTTFQILKQPEGPGYTPGSNKTSHMGIRKRVGSLLRKVNPRKRQVGFSRACYDSNHRVDYRLTI